MKLKKIGYFFIFYILICLNGYSQIKINSSKGLQWNITEEGTPIKFQLYNGSDSLNQGCIYRIQQGKMPGMELDTSGNFSWNPGFHLVDRIEGERIFQVIFESYNRSGTCFTFNADLKILHKNRPPVINELPIFYVQYNAINKYSVKNDLAFDEDNDPVVFVPVLETFPEGLSLNSKGEFEWNPSLLQFKNLKSQASIVEFYLQDQPSKTMTKGKLKIEATQQDLPPLINLVPKKEYYQLKENQSVNLRFYLSDPNGDDDISEFDFLTNKPDFPRNTLSKNSNLQYEFTWLPGYDFVQDPYDSLAFHIDFYVIDKSGKRDVKRVNFTVLNTINEIENDRKNYGLYYGTLTRAWELLEQLKEKEEELKKAYSKARKGKKNRSVVNASLGATTGLSSVFSKNNPDAQRLISSIGGTTVLTIGTLEATEVIGKSMKDLIDRLNYVIEKKNELQTKGDIFARDYSLKANRRNADFIKKVDDFMASMNLKGLVALELSASWEAKRKPNEDIIKKTFKDFSAW